MSLLTGMNDILKNDAAIEAANDMALFDDELALEADEFIDAMVDGEDVYEHPDEIDLMEEEDEEDDLLNEDLDIADEGLIKRVFARSSKTDKAKNTPKIWASQDITPEKANSIINTLKSGTNDRYEIVSAAALVGLKQSEFIKLITKASSADNFDNQSILESIARKNENGQMIQDETVLNKFNKLKMVVVEENGGGDFLLYSVSNGKFYDYFHEQDTGEDVLKHGVSYNDMMKSILSQIKNVDSSVASESFTDFDIYASEIAMEGALETLRNAVIKLCDSMWRKCTTIAGKAENEKKKKFFSDAADKFYNLSKLCKKANDDAEIKKHQKNAKKMADAVDKAINSGEDIVISLNSFIDSPEYEMMEAASEAYEMAKMEYEAATEAAALTGQSFLQSLLLNDDPITTGNGSIGYQDSAANYKDNYSAEFDNDDDKITTSNGSIGQKTSYANYRENFSAEFANTDDKIKTQNGSVGPRSSTPNPAVESALFFGEVMGEEVAMEGLIKKFKEKRTAKRDAKRSEILSKLGVADIDSEKFNMLLSQKNFAQAMKIAVDFGKKLEDGMKKLEDSADIKAVRRLIKTNSALIIRLETDKKVAEYVDSGMSEKDARKKVSKEMKNKAKNMEDTAQEAYIIECINMVEAFEASIGQPNIVADHSDNYSDGDIDDMDPIDTEDGEDVGDKGTSANPATESDLEEELRLLNESLLDDEELEL